MALSSCDVAQKAGIKIINHPDVPEGAFVEDTKVHDEIFSSLGELKVRKTFNPIENNAPAIGVQRNIDNKGTVDTSDDTVSIRFVAAVSITGELESATAVWTRAMFDTSGTAFKSTANWPSTTAYNALATNGDPYTITDYNNACGGSYTHFVAYTMRNIPLNDYASYYFTAYLTLNDGSGETVSKVVATTIDQTTQFSFNAADTGYFAVKHTNSGFEKVASSGFDNNGHYHADFEGMTFGATDSFLIVNRGVNQFQVFGYDAAHAVDPLDTEFTQVGSSQFLDCSYERSYFIHLDEYNRISVEEAFPKTLYFKPNANWSDGASKYILTLKQEGESAKRIYELNRIGNTNTYQCDCFYTASMLRIAPIAFYKLPTGDSLDLLGKPSISNLGWPLDNDDLFTMNIGNNKGYWSLRTEADPVIETGNFTITDFTEPVEIHTPRQKEYLAYTGDYTQMATTDYPDGNQHISNSLPVDVDFDFNVPGGKEIDHYSVVYGKEADLSDGYEKTGDTTTAISFYNPYLGKNYYKLVAHFTDSTSEESEIHNFYVDATCPRNLTIDGMTNCRDMGGRLLESGGVFKQGIVYRTSGKNQSGLVMTEATTEEMINHLHLRNEIYIADRGSSYACNIQGAPVNNFYMDWQATDGSSNFSRNCEPLKKFFNFMADSSNYPVFFHCKIGTDRTGLCATMLCGLVGVPLNEIYQDYLFSNFGAISGKRYIGEAAGHDNILRYTEYIQSFPGDTFQNKVYNVLLSIGVSRATLDAVINNLTDGPRATGNDAGQLSAFGSQLTPNGVSVTQYDNSDYSNHPAEYYTLTDFSTSVSYTFNANRAYSGEIVAYVGNGNNSNSTRMEYAINLELDNLGKPIRNVTYRDAGMGQITTGYSRWMYYPVILGAVNLSAGEHTIKIKGNSESINIAGITILDASTGAHYDGGDHVVGNWTVTTPATCEHAGEETRECICGDAETRPIAQLDHNYGDWEITTAATCEHSGERRHVCSGCGHVETETIAKLNHDFDDPVIGYAATANYIATAGYNCSSCHTGALRWSASDYDALASTNDLLSYGSYIRFGSGAVENKNGAASTGSHAVYKINNPGEPLPSVGLSFYITNTNGSGGTAPVFNTISGDSAMGAIDNGNGTYTTTTKRYGLRVNGVEYFLGDDDYGNKSGVTDWFDWPVSFPLASGVNTIDVFAYAGYRAQLREFQITGLPEFENSHQHNLGSWQHDDLTHWKECTAGGCPSGEYYHFNEDYHNFGDINVTTPATCTVDGEGTHTCTVCGYEEDVVIPSTGHTWNAGVITTPATCTEEGERTYTCTECDATMTQSIPALGHSWNEGEITSEPTCTENGVRTVTCTRCGATDNRSVPKLGHSWGAETEHTASEEGQVNYYTSTCSVDGVTGIRIAATDGTFGANSSNKVGTPNGYIKLDGNNQSISYRFNYTGAATTAKIYQRAIFDSWTNAGNKTCTYSRNATGPQGCNFGFTFNECDVDMTATKDIEYQTMLNGGTDVGLGSGYSPMADCLIGEVQLVNGVNTFTYTRLASMNLLVHDYIIVIE